MTDIDIRIEGHAGRITLRRPKALNALTYDMCTAIEAALLDWEGDPAVSLVVIDAEGAKAFCAGGDIAELYATGLAGDFDYGRRFWRDEYRMNALIAGYGKPVVSLMQGFTMGGGVGVGCHASHRIVGESSKIAMPECGIGLVPDVGGSLLLRRAPGALGAYLGMTGARMGPGCAIHAGFADAFVPEADWQTLIARLADTGDIGEVAGAAEPAPHSPLAAIEPAISSVFHARSPAQLVAALADATGDWAEAGRKALGRGSPLSMACALEMQHMLHRDSTLDEALALEYRFTHRAMEHGDFIEGIRAAIIDKDAAPRWPHGAITDVAPEQVAAMLAPLGAEELDPGRRAE
jgi:enoyl-CoA hydratase